MLKIQVNVLQIPRIWVDGKEMTFSLRKADALFYYLICLKTATREELIALLWEKCDIETGRKNLRNALYVVNKSLGTNAIIAFQKEKLSINPELIIDCDYTRLMDQDDYLAYRGPFLDGFSIKGADAYENWIIEMREHVKHQYLERLSRMVASVNEAGAVGLAERCALGYLRENPGDEEMSCFLMTFYQKQKKYVRAVQVYQKLFDYLGREMGISPMSSTKKQYYGILEEWNLAADDEQPVREREYIPSSQRRAFHELRQHCERFCQGADDGPVLFLQGKTGVGKTFLLSHILQSFQDSVCLLQVRCFPSERLLPYGIFRPLILELRKRFQTISSELQTIFQIFETSVSKNLDDEVGQTVLHLLSSMLCESRIVLCIEDIQWIDPWSIKLLDRISRVFFNQPLLIILSGRDILPEHVEAAITRGLGDRRLHIVQLPLLSLKDTYEWLHNAFDDNTAKTASKAVFRATDGNIGLLLYLCNQAKQEDNVPLFLLDGTRQLIDENLRSLSPQKRGVLRLLSYFPEGAPQKLVKVMLGYSDESLSSILTELNSEQFPIHTVCTEYETLLKIGDESLQRRCYEADVPNIRVKTHREIARALADFKQTESVLRKICYHFTQGDCPDEAQRNRVRFYALFLKKLISLDDQHIRRQIADQLPKMAEDLALVDRMPAGMIESDRQWLILLDLVVALFSDRDKDICEKLIPLLSYNQNADPALVPLAIQFILRYAWQKRNAQVLYNQLKIEDCDPQDVPVYIRLLQGGLLSLMGQYEDAECELLALLDSEQASVRACAGYELGWNSLRQNQEETRWFAHATEQAKELSSYFGIARFYMDAGRCACQRQEKERAAQFFQTALYLATKTDDAEASVASQAYLSLLHALTGQDEIAISFLEHAEKNAEAMQHSPLAEGILCYIKARLRLLTEDRKDLNSYFRDVVPDNVELLCRQGLLVLSTTLKAQPEIQGLRKCLVKKQEIMGAIKPF